MPIKKHTPGELAKIRQLFDEFDVDKSGAIEPTEVRTSMKKYGITLSDAQIQNLFDAVDDDHRGELDFKKFTKLCILAFNIQPTGEEEDDQDDASRFRELFEEFDTSGTGTINCDEVKICMSKFGVKLSDNQVISLICAVDPANKGQLEYHDFIKIMELSTGFEMITEDSMFDEDEEPEVVGAHSEMVGNAGTGTGAGAGGGDSRQESSYNSAPPPPQKKEGGCCVIL